MPTKVTGAAEFTIDFAADIEITGTPVINRKFTVSDSGDNTLIIVGANERIKLYKAILTVGADITGEVTLKIGSVNIAGIRNPRSGGQYVMVSTFPDYEYGALGDDLILNLPSAVTVTINVSYEI